MKLVISLLLLFILCSGCTPSAEEYRPEVIPEGLSDCKFFVVLSSSGRHTKVVRCPNSSTSTSYMQGKVQSTTVVIDGFEYVKKDNQ